MNPSNGNGVDALPPKRPSAWLMLVIAILIVVGPFTSPNGLWFCWCCSGSLTYIYINLSWRYRKWEMEQREKQALEEQQQPKKSKKSRVWEKNESKKQK